MYIVEFFTVEFLIIVFISALFSTEMFSSKIILFVQDICRRLFIRKFYHHFTPKHIEICNTINSLFDSLWKREPGYELTVIGQFYHFFGIIFSNHYYLESITRARRDYKRILQLKQVLDFIEHNYTGALTLKQLSASVSMSPKYFCRFFSEMTHQTPMDYLNRQRIERACYEISTTDDSITDIAYRNGFNDLSYFIRTFKKYKGTTPGKYKKS